MSGALRDCEVLVVGGGNAALCAALSARRAGARVTLLECAPKVFRGGNSRHTRDLRCMHDAPTEVLIDAYPEEEFFGDLWRVTGGQTDAGLARLTIRGSATCTDWMKANGVRFQRALGGTLHLGRTNAFFLGGGKALVNEYYAAAQRLGVEVHYDAEVVDLAIDAGIFDHAVVSSGGGKQEIAAKALVVASGGFESNFDWLRQAWGAAADNFLIRGTPYNLGTVLKMLFERQVEQIGDPTQCHAVAIDARAPKFDGGIATRVDCVSLGIVVNRDGERFYDEGEDFWPKRYAIWGRLVAQQPDQIAYCIVDAKSERLFMPSVFPPIRAGSIGELGRALGLDPAALEATVREFNAAVRPGNFNSDALDDCATAGLSPPKTHWARAIDTAPFIGYPLRPGITFTYLGVGVDECARVLMQDGRPVENLWAAGEIMAGNILGKGYLAGFGMTIGTVFGRIAGREAAAHARQ
jgi:tricarballylate dehydrogenase